MEWTDQNFGANKNIILRFYYISLKSIHKNPENIFDTHEAKCRGKMGYR